MNYEDCIFYECQDVTSWHGDVFDHPDYEYYCHKSGKVVKIIPYIHCKKCEYLAKNKIDYPLMTMTDYESKVAKILRDEGLSEEVIARMLREL